MRGAVLPDYPEASRRAFARNILRNTLRLRRGENLLVETRSGTLPWAESLVLEARIIGVRTLLTVEDEPTYWKSMECAPDAYLGQVGAHEWSALKMSHAHVHFMGPYDTAREKEQPRSIRNRLHANDHEWLRLIRKSGVRTVRWDLGRTSEFWARRYRVNLDRWRKELIEAASLDPRPIRRDGMRIAEVFRRGRSIRVTHPNGTDLHLRLAGRAPKVDDGVIDDNDIRRGDLVTVVPSGVIGVAVDEDFAEGEFFGGNASGVALVSNFQDQVTLRGGRWRFHRGRLAEYSFDEGEREFRRAYRGLGPGRDRPGHISIGLNSSTTSIPLLFDQERGVITLTIGHNSGLGGRTRTPRFIAYQSIRGADLEVDGRKVLESGRIVP